MQLVSTPRYCSYGYSPIKRYGCHGCYGHKPEQGSTESVDVASCTWSKQGFIFSLIKLSLRQILTEVT